MAEITSAPATPAGNATPAPAAPVVAPTRPSAESRIAAATKAFTGEQPPPEPIAAEGTPPPLPSTPVAPATEAVLRAEETASAQIRARNELADARKAFDAERGAWSKENQARLDRAAMLEHAFAMLERDPAVLLQAIKAKEGGRPVEEVLRDLYLEAADLEKLPAEMQAQARDQRARREIERRQAQIEAELQRERQSRAVAEMNGHLATYRGELASGLAGLGDGTPMLRELAQKRPDVAVSMLMDVAARMAVQAPQLGKQTAAQLAELVEREISAELEPFGGFYERKYRPAPAPPPASATPAPAVATPAPTIAPTMTDVTPVRRKSRNDDERLAAAIRAYGGGN